MQYRIVLCGFSEFESRAMHFSFQHPDADVIGYEVVEDLADADFAIVDADSKPAVKSVVQAARVADSVFVGSVAPPGAAALVPRPIDPARILRALIDLASFHHAPPHDAPLWRGFDDPDEIIIIEPPLLIDTVRQDLEPPLLTDTVPQDFEPAPVLPAIVAAEAAPEPSPALASQPAPRTSGSGRIHLGPLRGGVRWDLSRLRAARGDNFSTPRRRVARVRACPAPARARASRCAAAS